MLNGYQPCVGKFANTQACESRLLPLIMRLAILGSNARDGADKPRYFLMADKLIILPRCCAGKNQMMSQQLNMCDLPDWEFR